MKKCLILTSFAMVLIFLGQNVSMGMRIPPKPVKPVVSKGIEYRATHIPMGCVEAWDIEDNKMLWRRQIYYIKYDERLERDVQDVFIEKLEIKNNCLLITNEKGHQYELDLETRQVRPISLVYEPVYVEPVANITKGNTEFAFELYSKLAQEKKNENFFFSPYSISTALAMTYAGAKGNTEKQMADVLHFELPQDKLHPAFASLEKRLNEGGKKGAYELNVANALWGQKGYKFLDSFIELVNKNYSAGLNEVDFKKDAEGARQTINKWIENKTKDKIKELISPGVLDKFTRLVLTNAIYFKGKWEFEFDKKDTKDAPFHITATKETNVQMMYIKEHFKYADVGNLQVLELPYKGEDLSMIVLLPKKVDGIDELEKSLTVENLAKWIRSIFKFEVKVYLPKFTFTSEFSLGEILSQMGMPDAFNERKADFSGMESKKELFISHVLHKAFVEVNEEGTEAAAATAVIMTMGGMPPKPFEFRADHPFIFLIRDNKTGSVLFMGKVMNPVEK